MKDVTISSTGTIEEAEGMLQVDFANKFIGNKFFFGNLIHGITGGGVLSGVGILIKSN